MGSLMQINKYLANLGVTSRRKAEELVKARKVKVNGQIWVDLGKRIDPEKDKIEVDGKIIGGEVKKIYIILNKPKGIISSASDEHHRKTVVDWVKVKERVYPVGRLDENSTGLILLTNDGELANKLTHPKYEVPKIYHVLVDGEVTVARVKSLESGILLKEGRTAPAKVKIIEKENGKTRLEIAIHEGMNHQVKRMLAKIGLNTIALKRVALGNLTLGNLKVGEYRFLTKEEIDKLKKWKI